MARLWLNLAACPRCVCWWSSSAGCCPLQRRRRHGRTHTEQRTTNGPRTCCIPSSSKVFMPGVSDDDPAPTATTSQCLYAQGLGVARDPIVACALAQTSGVAAQMSSRRYATDVRRWEAVDGRERAIHRPTSVARLSYEDRLTASRSIGCFALGMPEQVLPWVATPCASATGESVLPGAGKVVELNGLSARHRAHRHQNDWASGRRGAWCRGATLHRVVLVARRAGPRVSHTGLRPAVATL